MQPEKLGSKLRARHRICGNARWVIVGRSGDHAGAKRLPQQSRPSSWGESRHERIGGRPRANYGSNPLTILHGPPYRSNRSEWSNVLKCAQTHVFATYTMRCSEEMRRPLQRPVQLPLTSEVQHGNHIDCSRGAVFTRWWRLGILSLARLARTGGTRWPWCVILYNVTFSK